VYILRKAPATPTTARCYGHIRVTPLKWNNRVSHRPINTTKRTRFFIFLIRTHVPNAFARTMSTGVQGSVSFVNDSYQLWQFSFCMEESAPLVITLYQIPNHLHMDTSQLLKRDDIWAASLAVSIWTTSKHGIQWQISAKNVHKQQDTFSELKI